MLVVGDALQKDPSLALDLKTLNALVDEYRCYFSQAAVLLSMGIYARQHLSCCSCCGLRKGILLLGSVF